MSQVETELTEREKIQKRLDNFTISISPTVGQLVVLVVERLLKSGQITIDELEAVAKINQEVKVGLEQFKNLTEISQKRLTELSEIENQENLERQYKLQEAEKEAFVEERKQRKQLERELTALKETVATLSAPVSKTSTPNITKVVNSNDDRNDIITISIPSKEELRSMSKTQILKLANDLKLQINKGSTKPQMIEEFSTQSEKYIKSLLSVDENNRPVS